MAADEKELREMMHEGFVNIIYIKKSTGEQRNAVATTNLDLIPKPKWPKENPKIKAWQKDGYVRYFDYTVMEWRCLMMSNICSYEFNDMLNTLRK